jgi:hypothetical protein
MTIPKPRNGHLARAACVLALAAGTLAAGCGSDDEGAPIPANIANQLETRLDEIERRFEFAGGACADIENDSQPAVDQLVASVPDDVDADVRRALQESFDRLFALTTEQCEQQQTETESEPEPAPAPEPEPVPTDTAPPETTETEAPPETDTAPAPEQTETTPPAGEGEEGEGGDAGAGGGEGGSGQSGQGGSGGILVPEDQG